MDIKPLVSVMSVRDFPIAWYWIHRSCRENRVDLLIVKYFLHHEAHKRVKEFFLSHEEYTHLINVTDDVIMTPSHLKLLIEDIKQFPDSVIGGYVFPISKTYPKTNLALEEPRGYVVFADQYRFLDIEDVITRPLTPPIIRAFFNGNTLIAIPREVVKKLSFEPYKWIYDSALGVRAKRGIMFDLQMSKELKKLGIPLMVDLRLLLIHFGKTTRFINLKDKKGYVKLVKYS